MFAFGLLLGGIIFVAGVAIYFLAPRVGPNPIFGVRVGYAYASREIWDKTNRFGGVLFILVGAGTAMLGLLLPFLNVSARDGVNALVMAMLVGVIGATVRVFLYARGLAQGTAIAREFTPIKFRWTYLAPMFITFLLFVTFAAYVYPALPVERVPSHFNINDQPDAWQSRNDFVFTLVGMSAVFLALNVLIVFIATREPMLTFSRWGKSWRLDPARGLIFVGLAVSLINLVFIAILWNVWWLVTRGVLAFSFGWILGMIVPLIAAIIGLYFVLGRKETT